MSVLGKDFKYVSQHGNIHSLYVDESYKIVEKYNSGFITHNDREQLDTDSDEDYEVINDYVYKYDDGYWCQVSCYDKCDDKTRYPELTTYHDKIIKYINETKNIRELLSMPNTVSVGLISKPGMGKSTLIRMICTTLNCDISIVKNDGQDYKLDDVTSALVVEDYDRFNVDNRSVLELSINGTVYSNTNIPIIFYTSNTTLDGINLDLIFKFDRHDTNTYKRSIELLYDDKYTGELLDIFKDNYISMREANQLLCAAYCSNDSPIDYIKSNIGKTMRILDDKFGNGSNIYGWGMDDLD